MHKKRRYIILIINSIILISIICHSCVNNQRNENDTLEKSIFLWNKAKESKDLYELQKLIETYPETENFDSAINLYFKRRNEMLKTRNDIPPPWRCVRNCRNISINPKGNIQFNSRPIEIDSVEDCVYKFISDTSYLDNFPDFKDFIDKNGNVHPVTKAIIEVEFIKDSVLNLQSVIIQTRQAYDRLKNDLSLKWYNQELLQLTEAKKIQIDSLFERRIIFSDITEIWRNNHFK